MERLKKTLEKFYREYNFKERVLHDPIRFPGRYRNPLDIEIAGFISASIAYGKVGLFSAVLEKLFSKMGSSPSDFIQTIPLAGQKKIFSGIKYRFNENEDILCLLHIVREVLQKHGSLEGLFMKHYNQEDPNIGEGLTGLVDGMLQVSTKKVYGKDLHPPGLLQFFSSPLKGSACKRANLFLRWMIRDRDIDFGIWKSVPKNKLIIPLDTHIARISRCLGLSGRKSQDWKMAVEISEALKKLDPADPIKYDFALCHHGISGACKGQRDKASCANCIFSNSES